MTSHILIIGAGIAGLSAGIYAKRSGFEVTILEQHTIPGGMCTGWHRKGYTFDGAIHWLNGSSRDNALHELWEEVGALDDTVPIYTPEPFKSLDEHGIRICLYRDLEKLRQHFHALSPEDDKQTNQMIEDVKTFAKMEMPITDIRGVKAQNPHKQSFKAILNMLAIFPKMNAISKLTVGEYADKFHSPLIRKLLKHTMPEDYNAAGLLFTMAWLGNGDGGYPKGGSLALTKRMADTFIALGGNLQLGRKADHVAYENGKAIGVMSKQELVRSDAVIITQDVIQAAEQLFDPPLQEPWIKKLKEKTIPSACCFVSLGIQDCLEMTPMFTPSKPIKCGGFTYDVLDFNNYSAYAEYAPKGCTALTTILLGDSYSYWKRAQEEGRYEAEKQKVANQILEAFFERYPHLKGKVEVIDVATPLTYERYTGSYRGSWMSGMKKGKMDADVSPSTLKQISRVYFAGHRTMSPGGLSAALITGRKAAQMVCREFDVPFISKA